MFNLSTGLGQGWYSLSSRWWVYYSYIVSSRRTLWCRAAFSAQIQSEDGQHVPHSTHKQWQNKQQKKQPQEYFKAKKWKVKMAESVTLPQMNWVCFWFIKTKLKAGRPTNRQPLKAAARPDTASQSRKELVISTGYKLQAVRICTRVLKIITVFANNRCIIKTKQNKKTLKTFDACEFLVWAPHLESLTIKAS